MPSDKYRSQQCVQCLLLANTIWMLGYARHKNGAEAAKVIQSVRVT